MFQGSGRSARPAGAHHARLDVQSFEEVRSPASIPGAKLKREAGGAAGDGRRPDEHARGLAAFDDALQAEPGCKRQATERVRRRLAACEESLRG